MVGVRAGTKHALRYHSGVFDALRPNQIQIQFTGLHKLHIKPVYFNLLLIRHLGVGIQLAMALRLVLDQVLVAHLSFYTWISFLNETYLV